MIRPGNQPAIEGVLPWMGRRRFEVSGRFIGLPPIPDALPSEWLRRKVVGLLMRREALLTSLATKMLGWRQSGFSVHHQMHVAAGDFEAPRATSRARHTPKGASKKLSRNVSGIDPLACPRCGAQTRAVVLNQRSEASLRQSFERL